MRTITTLNDNWKFTKPGCAAATVRLPHTWNAKDGQDGGNDYFRGVCRYTRTLSRRELPAGERVFLEIGAANSSADVILNGNKLAHHDGGYSAWRVELTDLADENLLEIDVDNSPCDNVYPQMADFTFYGGLYRGASLIGVPASHFELSYAGGLGLAVTPVADGADYDVTLEAWLTNPQSTQKVRFVVTDMQGNPVFGKTSDAADKCACKETIKNAHLWHGRKDPYLYHARAELICGETLLDSVETDFGCRSYKIDPERGFILNGEVYPLRGVARHQDRWGVGNALLPEHHETDIDLICEMGANTVRLAHYQHSAYFYELCDRRGLVVWAEIPYISKHLPTARENTLSQMRELVVQNYNHPSIAVWGLSNEITLSAENDPDLIENHRLLNDLCHKLDKTRPTTIAVVSMCDIHAEYLKIPDVLSYNHYFGWYGGDTSMNGPWFDDFHKQHPKTAIGLSEYGCEGLNWHTSKPEQGDYTEEYQAYYHEELIKQIAARPYLWATHVWNMFDFGADARNEGGENGQNHKGLVTFDRAYKKDSFFAYKAWLSDEPFVHICGKRYAQREEALTKITVYSNQPEVELFVNGKSAGKQTGKWFFYFDVPNKGRRVLRAEAGECTDKSVIRKVRKFNNKYRLKEEGAVLNWFDINAPKGYFSLNDKVGDILKTPQGSELFKQILEQFSSGGMAPSNFEITPAMTKMMGGFTVLRLLSMAGMAGAKTTKEQMLALNEQLNQIPKK